MAQICDDVAADQPAVIVFESGLQITFGEMEARSRQLARLFAARGLVPGDHIAVLLDNHARYLEVCWGARRYGLFTTPINWHLGGEEAGYIVNDCGAVAVVATARLASLVDSLDAHLDGVKLRLALDGPLTGFEDYERLLEDHSGEPIEHERYGPVMFYSSGTTGRPKGIESTLTDDPFDTLTSFDHLTRAVYGFRPGMVYLCPAPLYHAAPLGWSMAAHRAGGTVVILERFDAEAVLQAIERYHVTHGQFVPTHFIRLLKLDEEVRSGYDLSSLEKVVHAAAPCPVEVKKQMLDWLGPIVYEYYSGSEGVGFCAVGPEEWLKHPGTVGRPVLGVPHITDDEGNELGTGQVGQIWFETANRFRYHNDPEKTASVFNDRGWATLGDVGYLDEEGFMYLTDRVSHMIISGGVNIYPQEIEDLLISHPDVTDAGVIGVPDAEMGEAVMAVVQPSDLGADRDRLAATLDAYCRDHLAGFKCPRSYRFTDELPRLPTGKLLKRKLREDFGGSSAASVVGSA